MTAADFIAILWMIFACVLFIVVGGWFLDKFTK